MTDLTANIEKLNGYLGRFRDTGIQNLIGGQTRPALSGATFETTTPVDESLICTVARGGAEDIDAAAAAAKAVLARVDRLNEVLPEGLTLTGLYDQSVFIQSAINGVTQAGLYGALLAVLVLYLFLREARPTLIIALAIPISVIVTFMPMRFAGLSLNIMSLGGMALAIGLLVDNAIVVLENIARRREAGASLVDAAVAGAGEVSGAIVASTLTTVAVFFPMVFVQGIAGQLFADQALVVTFALLVSLAVSLTVIPTLAARGGQRHEIAPRESLAGQARWRRGVYGVLRSLEWLLTWLVRIPVTVIVVIARTLGVVLRPVVALWNRAYGALARGYARLLDAALKARALVLIVATLAFAGSLWLATQLGVELIPPMDQGEFSLEANLPPGTPLEGSDRFLRQVQSAFQDDPAVRTVYGVAGTGNRLDSNPELGGENVASISFAMADGTDEMALRQRIRERVEHTPGLEYRFETPTLFSTEKPLEVEIAGYDLAALERIAASLQSRLEDSERFVDVESTSEQGQPEVRVVFEQERAAALGLQVSDLAARVVTLVQGDVATRYRVSDREIDVVVRGKEANQTSYDDLKRLVINPESEHPIPLESVASVRLDRGPAEIRRTAQQRVVVLSMDLAYGDLGSAVEELDTHLADIHVPRGISTRIGGQSEEMEVSFRSLQLALGLAIFLVYLVMASQFESLIHPFVILFSVPLAAIGAFTALFITGTEINVVALIGLIVLAGIVVNNAIVLIDLINRLRADGQTVLDAIREAGQTRLRPILMTTLTTALGLLPLALGGDDGAEVRAPLAITVIGGLMVSTLLTLVVIPVVYSLVTRDRPATGTASSETPA